MTSQSRLGDRILLAVSVRSRLCCTATPAQPERGKWGQVQTDLGAQIKLVAWSLVPSRADVWFLTQNARVNARS